MYRLIIQIFYKIFVTILFLISLPVQLLLAILVYMTSGWPIIYCQKRTGKNNTIFTLIKFRTMVPAADKLKQKLADKNEANGPAFKIYNDPRLTTIGKILSHTGLDELPQLYNILHGDMAIVGPRPLPVPEAKKLLLWQRERTIVKPGIVSPWVVNGYHSNSFEEWMKSDIIYAHSKNMFGDVLLLARGLLFFIELVAKETGRMYERIQL